MKIKLILFSIFYIFSFELASAKEASNNEDKKIANYESKFVLERKENYLTVQEKCEKVDWHYLREIDKEKLRQAADYSQFMERLSKSITIPRGYQRYAKVEGGWIVSFDAGEFSQSTWFFSEAELSGRNLINKAMDVYYFFDKKLYGFYSYSHLMGSHGALFSIGIENKKFHANEISAMKFSPILFSDDFIGDEFVAVTRSKILSIHFDGSFKEVATIEGLGKLAPTWIEVKNGSYRIGLRNGYVNINLKEGTQEWFMYSGCAD